MSASDTVALSVPTTTATEGARRKPFMRNAWYVAGYSSELTTTALLGRTLLGLPVLLFRDQEGKIKAIGNRCPHRFVPLSLGSIVDGQVRCGYHGLGFDSSGRCVHNPHGPTGRLAVPAYPLEERHGLLWIWMGDREAADASLVPDFAGLDPMKSHVRTGYLHGQANYELMTDNILDLSHIEFLHPALGTEAVSRAKVEVSEAPGMLSTTRRIRDEVLPSRLALVYRSGAQRVHRTMSVSWQAPANMVLTVTIEPADPSQEWQTGSQTLHLFTPETEQSTHYFYVGIMPRSTADEATADSFIAALGRAFTTEDKPMIEAQAGLVGDRDIMDLKPALFPIDKAPVRARRLLAQLIAGEQG